MSMLAVALTGALAAMSPSRAVSRSALAFAAPARTAHCAAASRVAMAEVPAQIQFIKGVDEPIVPDIKLTRSKDGSTGTATFLFDQPSFLEATDGPQSEITGMFMVDDEGELVTTDVNAKFVNGKPRSVECVYVMRDPPSWDRMMRFLVRRVARRSARDAARPAHQRPRVLTWRWGASPLSPPSRALTPPVTGTVRRVARPGVPVGVGG